VDLADFLDIREKIKMI